jgi:hypothetical protein
MMDVESVVQRLLALETKYLDLQDRYGHLIHEYEILKEKYENLQKVQSRVESDGVCEG